MKKVIGLGFLCVGLACAESVSPTMKAYLPDETSLNDQSYAYAPATVYYDGVYHQFYCSTGGFSDYFSFHYDDYLGPRHGQDATHGFLQSWDHIRYRTSKNGTTWSPAEVVMTQTSNSFSQRQHCACDPAIIKGDDDYWYLYYAGNIDSYNTVVYVSRSKTIGGPYLTLTKRDGENKWERWPKKPKPILRKWTGNQYNDGSIYGVGQVSVVKRGKKDYHFWFADNSETGSGKMTIKYATSDRPDSIPPRANWKTISITGRTGSNGKLDIIDFGEVRWNPKSGNSGKYEMWLFSKVHDNDSNRVADQYIYKYTSEDGIKWTRTSDKDNHFGGPYYGVNNLGVSADEKGWIYDKRYLLSFGGPSLGLKKKASNFDVKDRYGNTKVYASFPWAMWQMIVGGTQTSKIRIPYGSEFPVKSKNLEFISGDFDGDGVTDIAAVDRSTSKWYICSSQSTTNENASFCSSESGQRGVANIPWGWKWEGMTSSHTIVTGDYDGDGKTDRVIVDRAKGLWYMISSRTGLSMHNPTNDNEVLFGWKWEGMNSKHKVLTGDYDGDDKTDRAIIDTTNGAMYIISSRTGYALETADDETVKTPSAEKIWGLRLSNWDKKNSRVLVGDYDGDGVTDFASVNVSTKKWYVVSSQTGFKQKNLDTGESLWGWSDLSGLSSTSIITTGDYNGDGAADRGYVDWANGKWFHQGLNPFKIYDASWNKMKNDMKNASKYKVLEGDYDGDGATDHAFVNLDTRKIYMYSSMNEKKGISRDIEHVYPFQTGAVVLAKEAVEEKNVNVNIMPTVNALNISVNGNKLVIQGANDGDRVSVMDAQGRMVRNVIGSSNEMNLQLPSTGMYIVRVGSMTRKIAIK